MRKESVRIIFLIILFIAISVCILFYSWDTKSDKITDESSSQLVVGFVELLSESSWRDKVTSSIKQAALENNVQLITVKAERTQESQKEAIRALVVYQVDAIVFSPVVKSGWDNVLAEAKAANIPIILSDRNLITSVEGAIYTYVGSKYEDQGEEAALFIKQKFMKGADTVKIVELYGTVGSSPAIERSKGIRETFGKDRRFNIFYSVSGDYLFSKAKELFETFLKNNKEVDVLISYNDAMTFGAIEAMEEAGIVPGSDIVIVTFDGEQKAIDLLSKGKINCVIESNPIIGDKAIKAAMDICAKIPVEESIYVDESVFTQTSDLINLPPRDY